MEMHPYFTEIPLRSWKAIVRRVLLSEVLLSLVVDPLESEDVSKQMREIGPTWIRMPLGDAPIRYFNFEDLGSKALSQMQITIAQWVMTDKNASSALSTLTDWDKRFGVWCACAVARTLLRFVPEGELLPLRAIETAEAWSIGKASIKDCRAAVTAAFDAAEAAYRNDNAAAAEAAYAAADVADAAAETAVFAAADIETVCARAANANSTTDAEYADELIRLREVVANACMTFPG
jgi:hypothetical protein